MAAISEILARNWLDQQWVITGEDYDQLIWNPENTLAMPTLAEIEALSAATDEMIAAEQLARRKAAAFDNTQDAILTALDILTETLVDEVVAKLRANATVWQATPNLTRINALKTRINQIKAMT